jgi:hypothetical protein
MNWFALYRITEFQANPAATTDRVRESPDKVRIFVLKRFFRTPVAISCRCSFLIPLWQRWVPSQERRRPTCNGAALHPSVRIHWHTPNMSQPKHHHARPSPLLSGLTLLSMFCALAAFSTASAGATAGTEGGAGRLMARYSELKDLLARNAFGRPLEIESSESASLVDGHAYAVLDQPFNKVSAVFKSPAPWCEVVILHINTKYCRASSGGARASLRVNVGKKTAQDLSDTSALDFSFNALSTSQDYLDVQLNADKGPMGTSNYTIELKAVPLPDARTFIELRYAYGYGLTARLAMQTYLSTSGRGKVGFTPINQGKAPGYVGGMRGAVERNTMRYYLAIEAYLASLKAPAPAQFDARLEHWFKATEQYPLQLHEMDFASYKLMKTSEYRRQQLSGAP